MGIKFKQLLIVAGLLLATNATARDTYNFNSDWRIGKSKKTVTLPRAWNEDEAYKVYIHSMSDSVIWYRKNFVLPESAKGKKVFIEFEGETVARLLPAHAKRRKSLSTAKGLACAKTVLWLSVSISHHLLRLAKERKT